MQLQQIYIWAKKIHKWLLWFVTIVGSWMMVSGYLLHKESENELNIQFIDMEFVRHWHNQVSQYFLVLFALQMGTGLLMWALPKILRSRTSN